MTRGDIAITPERWAASVAKMRAERDADPVLRDMDAAAALTKTERAEIEAAEAALREAEQAVNTAGIAGSKFDLEEARVRAQNQRRRLNATVRSIDAARQQRRRAAKAKHDKPQPVKSQRDPWMAAARGREGR